MAFSRNIWSVSDWTKPLRGILCLGFLSLHSFDLVGCKYSSEYKLLKQRKDSIRLIQKIRLHLELPQRRSDAERDVFRTPRALSTWSITLRISIPPPLKQLIGGRTSVIHQGVQYIQSQPCHQWRAWAQ